MGTTPTPERLLVVGRVTGAFGVRGWVKVHSYTEPREEILAYGPWRLGPEAVAMDVADGQPHGKGLIARLAGVEDRDAAEALRGSDIRVPRSRLPEADPDEYYWADLLGLEVRTVAGVTLGRVERLLETGANDVLVVAGGGREHLVPFVPGAVVTRVDLDAGEVVVDWDPDF
jgi:16S rRNA processing protein RimM